jgi:hypothetical protein
MLILRRGLQPLLVCVLAVAGACLASGGRAQTVSVTDAAMGKVAAASSGVTSFRFAPASGTVSVVSGTGSRTSTGAVRFSVNIACGVNNWCKTGNTVVTVGAVGTPTGRAGSLTNFTFNIGTATLVYGSGGSTNPLSFTIGPIGNNNSVLLYVGADLPIYGDDQAGKPTGAATSGMYVTIADSAGHTPVTSGANATATVSRQLKISQDAELGFGTIYRPSSGSGTVSLPASTGVRSITGNGGGYMAPTPTRAQFTITGEGGQTVSITVPSTISLVKGASTINVSTSNTGSGAQVLSGGIGSGGSFSFYVGGAFSLNSTTTTGAYTGTYTITTSYN